MQLESDAMRIEYRPTKSPESQWIDSGLTPPKDTPQDWSDLLWILEHVVIDRHIRREYRLVRPSQRGSESLPAPQAHFA